MLREVPPTAGLPMQFTDLFYRAPDSLEEAIAAYLGVPAVQIESSGTAALIVALSYLKKHSHRRTVVIPGYTCPLVPIAIAQAGLSVKLCDSRPDSYDFDEQCLRSACDSDTLAVMPTHFGGIPADIEPVLEIARAAGAYVIEDAAQSLGALHNNRLVGTIGDIGLFSLSCGKGLTIYQGGFVAAADPALSQGLQAESQEFSRSNFAAEFVKSVELLAYGLMYNPFGLSLTYGRQLRAALAAGKLAQAVGDEFPLQVETYRVSAFRRRLGRAAFSRLVRHVADCRQRGTVRAQMLNQLPAMKVLAGGQADQPSYPFLTVVFDEAQACNRALDTLWRAGVGVTKLFVQVLPDYQYLRPVIPAVDLIQSRSFAQRALTISNSQFLDDKTFAFVVQSLQAASDAKTAAARTSSSVS